MFKCRYGHYYYYYPDLKDCCPLVGPPLLCGVLCLLFKDSLTLSLFQTIVISGTQQTLRYCFISCCVSLLIYSGRRESGKEVNTVKETCVWSGEAKVCCWLQSLFFLLVRKQAQRRLFYVFWVFLFRWGLNCRQLVGQEKKHIYWLGWEAGRRVLPFIFSSSKYCFQLVCKIWKKPKCQYRNWLYCTICGIPKQCIYRIRLPWKIM